MSPTRPTVTVLVVNYDGAHLLGECLASVQAQTVPPGTLQVVVVDNASRDGSVALLRRDWPQVRVVANATNLGFAGGNNVVLRDLETDHVLLLNNDATLAPDAVEQLLAAAAAPEHERTAALTPLILLRERFRPDPTGPVQGPAGRFAPDADGPVELVNSTGNLVLENGFGTDRGWLQVRGTQSSEPEVFGFCGAAALLRRAALEEVGVFDDDFFMYYEDTDLSWRLRHHGWQVHHVPSAVVYHRHAASSREGSDFFRFHDDRNRLLTLTKNASWPLLARTVLRYPLTAASLLRSEWPGVSSTRVRLRVIISYLRLLPRAVSRRRALQRAGSVSRPDVEALLVPVPERVVGPYRTDPSGTPAPGQPRARR